MLKIMKNCTILLSKRAYVEKFLLYAPQIKKNGAWELNYFICAHFEAKKANKTLKIRVAGAGIAKNIVCAPTMKNGMF